jgi:oligosaccharide repeat unit polymerase
MLINLIPLTAGLVYARIKEFGIVQMLIVTAVLALTLWYGFSTGTRNVFATYIITFAGAYFLTKPGIKMFEVILLGVLTTFLLTIAMIYMLEFRTKGLDEFSFAQANYNEVYIDHNIVNVSRLTSVFPDSYEFLGLEVPFNALIRPVPRFFWPNKPEGLSVSIESALGVSRMTVSCTFIGEAYMAGGFIAVLIFGLVLGGAAALWNRVGEDVGSPLSQLVYVSGFVCAAVAMRSVLSMVPLMLPTLALWIYKRVWTSEAPSRRELRTVGDGRLRPPDKLDGVGT